MSDSKFTLYDLNEKSGWLLSSFMDKEDSHYSPLLQLGRTNFLDPWEDKDFHHHTNSLEIYLLVEGILWIAVDNIPIRMKGCSLLVVQPGFSHSVIGGEGKINHYGMKVPHSNDERVTNETPENILDLKEKMKTSVVLKPLKKSVGFYIDLNKKENQNHWILGFGNAFYETDKLCLAYVNFPNKDEFEKDTHPYALHYHVESTEWYLTLEGKQTLLVNDEEIGVSKGNLLRVPKNTPHNLISYEYPFRGVTIRTPNVPEDKIILEEIKRY